MRQATIIGGPKDGEQIPVQGLVLNMIEQSPRLCDYVKPDAEFPPFEPWRGVHRYHLHRDDDDQRFYVREEDP